MLDIFLDFVFQMTASNLAICFAPSLFHVYGIREILPKSSDKPAKHRGVKGGEGGGGSQKLTPPISQNELHEQQAAQECLTFMISYAKELFSVSLAMLSRLLRVPYCCCFCSGLLLNLVMLNRNRPGI